jgi:CCR4-NOT transcription complex subunit 1
LQLRFLEPFLRNAELTDAVRLLYKGTLRVLLVLLHDFPEFLCEFHFHLCDVIPPSCIQVRLQWAQRVAALPRQVHSLCCC